MSMNVKRLSPILSARRLVVATALLLIAGIIVALLRTPEPKITGIALHPDGEFHVGQTVECTLRLQTPWFALPRIGEFDTRDTVQIVRKPQRSLAGLTPTTWRWTYRIRLQPLENGDINPGTIEFITQPPLHRDTSSAKAQLPQLSVVPRPKEEIESVAVADPVDPSASDADRRRELLLYGLAAAALLAAGVLLALLWRHRRRARPNEADPAPPPHERALTELQNLESRLPMDPAPFYVELTDILRTYVEQRFHIRAAEQTTPEFLRSIARKHDIQADHRQALETCMLVADKIKFARGQATQDELRQSLAQARSLIADTAPRHDENPDH